MSKPSSAGAGLAWLSFCVALILVIAPRARAAGPFTVSTLADTHAVSPSLSPNDSGGNISLRSAIEAASAQPGATTINLPAGVYNLSLGELAIAPSGNRTTVISGAGAASTVVNQTDGSNRVFNIDFSSVGGTVTTLLGITVQGGRDLADGLGGAGILAGSVTSTPKDTLTLNNCVVQGNQCRTNTTQEPGGGIQMAGGDLALSGCTFSNNNSGQSFGGAVFMLAQSVVSALRVTNSIFLNNSMTNNSGAGPNGGGALMIMTPPGSVHQIVGSTFGGNRVLGNLGNTYGGAIQLNGGTLNIQNSTFVTNSAIGQGGLGGALYVDSGTVSLSFCRLAGNTASNGGGAVYNHGSNGANTTATNNWWGCGGGPGAGGCDAVASDGGTMVFNPWIVLTNTASPGVILRGQSSLLTASVLLNSSNQALTPAQVPVLIGLPLTWGNVAHGSLSAAQAAIQANGDATAIFTNDNSCNNGSADATLDSGTATATVIVQCADLTLAKTNNVGGSTPLGTGWTWTLHAANGGAIPATFSSGQTLLLDNLPGSSISYGPPALANLSGVTGSLLPSLDGSANLTVTAQGTVVLSPGASFDVSIAATPGGMGTFANPRNGGVCAADPNNNIPETSKANNAATDSVVVTCPAISGTVSGGTAICPGGSALLTVTLSGGTPPYTVALTNGGGTQTGTGPLSFLVSPGVTTTYQVSSGTDALGCPVANSGPGATVTVGASLPPPVITLTPASVFANSAGNQASAPSGYAAYAWTITNGIITSPANLPFISYVAGSANSVVLGLTVFNGSGCSATNSITVPVTTGFSVHTNVTFTDALLATSTGMAFDGTNYWSCSGGSSIGVRLARYSLSGALVATYSPGLDFRSVFTRADGIVLARGYNSGVIYQQTSPGVFADSGITLTGGNLDLQSAVVLNGAYTEYQALSAGGLVSRWSTNGSYLGVVNLGGFGAVPGEDVFPQNRGLMAMGNLWLTYNGAGVLSIWDTNGVRVLQVALPGAGTNFNSNFGFAFANGKVFIVDVAGGQWRGFDLYGAAAVGVLTAESLASWNQDVASKISSVGFVPRIDVIPVAGVNTNPTLAQLRSYQSLMVYSDSGFGDPIGLGNVVADYVDQGGGAVLQTFVFATNNSVGIQGRLGTSTYLPFTAASYSSPGSQTLVKLLPLHPLLDGVNTFNGGTSSYQNTPLSIGAGATLVGQWSGGQPLVGAKDVAPGRTAGLNFFPVSSDSRSDFWVAGTDGARLMADALVWSGRIPPAISVAPGGQVVAVGGTASFSVTSAGTAPLTYQWRLNGTNIAGANASTLSFVALGNTFGAYSVVVSNLYGATTSLEAALNPPLQFLRPSPVGGNFSLFLVNADGSPVAPARAPRVRVYTTMSVALPLASWMPLTNTVVPSGGQLRVDGLSVTNGASQFFRAVEAP